MLVDDDINLDNLDRANDPILSCRFQIERTEHVSS